MSPVSIFLSFVIISVALLQAFPAVGDCHNSSWKLRFNSCSKSAHPRIYFSVSYCNCSFMLCGCSLMHCRFVIGLWVNVSLRNVFFIPGSVIVSTLLFQWIISHLPPMQIHCPKKDYVLVARFKKSLKSISTRLILKELESHVSRFLLAFTNECTCVAFKVLLSYFHIISTETNS